MSYPGNSSLAEEIQQRILGTFKQTLTLAADGSRQEALLGCDFILRLDPLFEPARVLQERIEKAEGPVSVEEFRQYVEEPSAAGEPAPADDTAELDADALFADQEPEPAATAPPRPTAPSQPAAPQPAAPQPAAPQPAAPETGAEDVAGFVELDDLDLSLDAALADTTAAGAPVAEGDPSAEGAASAEGGEEPPLTIPETVDDELSAAPAPAPPTEKPAAETPPAAPPPSAEPPTAAPPTAAPSLSLDSEPAARLDSESEQRVAELLDEGQTAFDRGEYQGAIDAWSRIFLIDIDHREANRRIELARKLKAEVERKLEEAFHEAMSQLEAGRIDEAERGFERVLEMQPHHLAAQEYLDKIRSGELVPKAPAGGAAEAEPAAAPEPPAAPKRARPARSGAGAEDLAAPRMVQVARKGKPAARPAKEGPKRALVLVGATVLLAVVGGGWWVYSNWNRMFPNSAPEQPPAGAPVRPDPLVRAKALHEEGRTSMAISQLRRLSPESPEYAEAQALIAQWEAAQLAAEAAAAAPSPEEEARRDELLASARAAYERREFLRASELVDEAAKVAPLGPEAAQLKQQSDARLEKIRQQITLVRQGDWEFALRDLWLIHDADPGNRDVVRLMTDAYFNLGVRDLQRGDAVAATENFSEALNLTPDDPGLRRLARFAAAYQQRPEDLLYRIFVKYQPFR